MSFTQIPITHEFSNGDGTPASGSVQFCLSEMMSNEGQSILPTPLNVALNAQGQLSASLPANNDPGTTPQTAVWQVRLELTGAQAQDFTITVPNTDTSGVDLMSLIASEVQVG